jgi:hypothetical protein
LEVAGTVKAGDFQGSGTIAWQVVSGTSVQAQPNCGYLVTNATQVTVTLPLSPAIGDVVRITGAGAGGWKGAQNTGQQIIVSGLGAFTTPWIEYTNYGISAVASSADGSKLSAVSAAYYPLVSTNSGLTWIQRNLVDPMGVTLAGLASSSDGTKLVTTSLDSWANGTLTQTGLVYTSTDSGVSWTPHLPINYGWGVCASSADGTKLVVGQSSYAYGCIYTSADSGATWTQRQCGQQWTGLASSSDGTKLAACGWNGGVYTSTDSGATWTLRTNATYSTGIASSADGTKLVVVGNAGNTTNGIVLRSTDSGATWQALTNAGQANWRAVASSADGTRLAAVDSDISGPSVIGRIHVSVNSGATWTLAETNRAWSCIASSADGSTLVAGVAHYGIVNGGVYASSSRSTTSGTAGYLTGSQTTAVELQYAGNNQFLPISHEGTLSAH